MDHSLQLHNELGIPERILQMRGLNKQPERVSADARLFYVQGCFMAEYEDNYNEYVPLFDSQPTYETLSTQQLRFYFTWRASVRNRRAVGAGICYIYLYFFELINNIGVSGNLEALEHMAYIINTYINNYADSAPLFKSWFRDYYALNNIDIPFPTLIQSVGLAELFPLELCDQIEYAYTLRICSQDITKNPIISEFGFIRFVECYNTVIKNLRILFKMYGLDIENLFEGVFISDNAWFPYEYAIFYNISQPKERVLHLNRFEQYVCVRGVWIRRVMSFDPSSVSVINMIVTKITAALCTQTASSVKPPDDLRQTPYAAVINDRYLDDIIISAAKQCLQAAYTGELLPVTMALNDQSGSGIISAIWRARSIPAASNSDREIARQFVSQAHILADYTDNYGSAGSLPGLPSAKCTYSILSVPQIRMYIAWRTSYVNKNQTDPNPMFARIYANELINKVGAGTDLDILEKLAGLIVYAPEITEIFLDYFITHSGYLLFSDVIRRFNVYGYFPHIIIQNRDFKDWFRLFADKLDHTPDISVADAFNLCIAKLWDYFDNAGLSFLILFLCMDNERRAKWSAFSNAVYLNDHTGGKAYTSVSVSDYDSYAFNTAYRKWVCTSASAINPKSYYLIDYIIKRLSAHMRKTKIPKMQLKRVKNIFPPSSTYSKYISAIMSDGFTDIIDKAFQDHKQSGRERIKVKVDINLLDGVRKSADANLEKLMTAYEDEEIKPEETIYPQSKISDNGWESFKAALSEMQRRALTAVLDGKTNELHALARAESIMAEVLIESINNTALIYTGDYIIEETDAGPKIFEEYFEAVASYQGRLRSQPN